MRIVNVILGLCVLALVSGCNPSGGASVAIIDVQRVAKETGLSDNLNTDLETFQQKLQDKLTEVQNNLTTQINEKKKEIGEKPSEKQRDELAQLFGNAKQQYQQAQQSAAKNLEAKRAQLVNAIRDKIRPVARKVANSRGMKVVLVKSEILVLDFDSSADITDAVVSEMMISSKPVAAAPVTESEPAAAGDKK